MIELQRIELRKIVYFDKARFDFKPGITFIQGWNKNAARGKNASNGAGKSSLFIPLYNTFGFSNPIIRGKRVMKDVYQKGSYTAVEFRRGKTLWRVQKSKSKITIERDGKDLNVRTIPLAQERIDKLLDYTEDEFFSLVYLDSGRAHTFQIGTSAERFHFITRIFRMSNIDEIRRWLRSEIGDMESDMRMKDEIKTELESIVKDFDGRDMRDLEADYKDKVHTQEVLNTNIQEYTRRIHVLEIYQKSLPQIERKDKLQAALDVHENDLDKEIKRTARTIDEYADNEKRRLEYDAWLKRSRKANLKKQALFERLGKEYDLRTLDTDIRTAETMESESYPKPTKPEVVRYEEALGALKKYGLQVSKKSHKKLLKALGKYKGLMDQSERGLVNFDKHIKGEGTCPVCTSVISREMRNAIRKGILDKIEKAHAQVDRIRELQKYLDSELTWKQYVDDVDNWREDQKLSKKIRSEYDLDTMRELREILHRLASLEEPEKPEKQSVDMDSLRKRLQRMKELQTIFRSLNATSDLIDEAKLILEKKKVGDISKLIGAYRLGLKEKQQELSKLSSKIPKLRSKIDLLKEKQKRYEKLVLKMGEIDGKTSDLPVYKALLDAYGPGGIKLLLIRRLTKMLEANLNRFSQVLFRENYRFSLEADERNFVALVHRKHGSVERTSDIRHLSGAERRVFALLFLLALLPLIPESRRFDTIILDEPDANVDSDLLEIMKSRLLPQLNKVVPKLVVISPKPEIVTENGKVFTVVKDGSNSTLVRGMVHG